MTLNQRTALTDIYNRLLERYGPQGWWPADTPFEVILGAILTQNTAWRNVETALASLKEAAPLELERILDLEEESLQQSIRPSGYYRQKARRLRTICRYLLEKYDGDILALAEMETADLRDELLKLDGIGPETADSIILYAFERPVFVVDAYTMRIFGRLGHLRGRESYNQVQAMFTQSLELDADMFNEYHALIVRHGKQTCRKTDPLCPDCCLLDICRLTAAA
ncbi:endonuclease III domain-containing protein [bacterium]|nr:MAG: endonuclease III domain-containing protein [bacterium]